MVSDPCLRPWPLRGPLSRTAICVCGQAGPLLQGLLLPVPAAVAAVVVVGHSLAGWGAVQGSVAEMSHMGALGRQRGDGALHGAGVRGRLRAGRTWVGTQPARGTWGRLQGGWQQPWHSLSQESSSPPNPTLSLRAHCTRCSLCLPGRAGPRQPVGLSIPGGQGGCQEEGGCGPGWKNPEDRLSVRAQLAQGHEAACPGLKSGPAEMRPPSRADPQPLLSVLKLDGRPAGQDQEGEKDRSHHQWEAKTSFENESQFRCVEPGTTKGGRNRASPRETPKVTSLQRPSPSQQVKEEPLDTASGLQTPL